MGREEEMAGQRMTLIHDAVPAEDLAWRLAWPQSFSELEIRGPGFNIPSLIRHWLWTALKGSTTLGKVVSFRISKKKLKLRLSFATLSTTRKKTERASVWCIAIT